MSMSHAHQQIEPPRPKLTASQKTLLNKYCRQYRNGKMLTSNYLEFARLLIAANNDLGNQMFAKLITAHHYLGRQKNAHGHVLLHSAANWSNLEATTLLLALEDPPVNLASDDGETPLHFAARRDNYDIISLLLGAGTDPFLNDNYGRLPLNWAKGQDHQEIILLLEHYMHRL